MIQISHSQSAGIDEIITNYPIVIDSHSHKCFRNFLITSWNSWMWKDQNHHPWRTLCQSRQLTNPWSREPTESPGLVRRSRAYHRRHVSSARHPYQPVPQQKHIQTWWMVLGWSAEITIQFFEACGYHQQSKLPACWCVWCAMEADHFSAGFKYNLRCNRWDTRKYWMVGRRVDQKSGGNFCSLPSVQCKTWAAYICCWRHLPLSFGICDSREVIESDGCSRVHYEPFELYWKPGSSRTKLEFTASCTRHNHFSEPTSNCRQHRMNRTVNYLKRCSGSTPPIWRPLERQSYGHCTCILETSQNTEERNH